MLLPSVVTTEPITWMSVTKPWRGRTTIPKTRSSRSSATWAGRDDRRNAIAHLPFADAPGMVQFETQAGIVSPVRFRRNSQSPARAGNQGLGDEIAGAVITVPAYFDDAQRQATKDAAKLAGLEVFRLLNEPTAAAVAYGLDQAAEGVYAVYDLGGGTFDISILKLTRGVFEVLATNGDPALGGDDFDRAVYDWILRETGISAPNAGDARRLLSAARAAKERLSDQTSVLITTPLSNGTAVKCTLSRETFDTLTSDLVKRTITPVRKALRDAGCHRGHQGRCSSRRGHPHALYPQGRCGFLPTAAAGRSRPGQSSRHRSRPPSQCSGRKPGR